MTTVTNTLTATEIAQRDAALKAASAAIGKAADVAALDTAAAVAAINAAGKPADQPVDAKPVTNTPHANALRDMAAAAADKAAAKPVDAKPTTTAPTPNVADKAPQGVTAATPDKPGTKANPLPKVTAGSQGGSSGGKASGKPKPAKPTGKAGKPLPADAGPLTQHILGKGNGGSDKANPVIEGFDLSRWPSYAAAIKPERWAILAAAAPLVGDKPVYKPGTSNHLALAAYFMMGAEPTFNYFDVGECVGLVRNTQPDNKSNCANRWSTLGLGYIQKRSPVPFKNPAKTGTTGGRMAYGLTLFETDNAGKVTRQVDGKVVRKIAAYLEANNCKAPAKLFGPLIKPTDKALPSK